MTASLEKNYQELGERVAAKMPADWARAWVSAEQNEANVRTLKGWFESEVGAKSTEFVVGPNISRLLLVIERQVRPADAPLLKRITYSLTKKGQFELELED